MYSNRNRNQKQHQQQPISESPIKVVQIDGLVILKIIKHCQEENCSPETQGQLLGLVYDNRLEITNCFPLPRSNEDDETEDTMDYQYTMIRHLRNVNVDYLQIGWYQCNPYGSNLNKLVTVDYQYQYQTSCDEAVVLFFDPIRTQRGFLSLKAYRLTNLAMSLCKDGEFKPETLRQSKMSYEKFFEEIPIVIRNSHLIKALLLEIEQDMSIDAGRQILDIGGFSIVEKSLQSHIKSVEELNKQTYTLRNEVIKKHEIARENLNRANAKLQPLGEEEVAKIMKPFKLTPIQRLENMLTYSQISNYSQQSALNATTNIGKLFIAKALQNTNAPSSTTTTTTN